MKNIFYLLFLFFTLVSCKKEEAKHVVVAKEPVTTAAFVGTNNNGIYKVTDIDVVKRKWNIYINKKLKPKDSIVLQQFSIVKTISKGDTIEECYLLTARAEKQNVTIGTTLSLKDGKFYTDLKQNSGFKTYEVLICDGVCGKTICNPEVVIAGGSKRLICSSCDECAKISGSVD